MSLILLIVLKNINPKNTSNGNNGKVIPTSGIVNFFNQPFIKRLIKINI